MESKRSLELVTSPFGLQNVFRKFTFSMIYHLCNFDDLVESGV